MKTVNLELSKQLKDAGYPQESVYYWYQSPLATAGLIHEGISKHKRSDLHAYASPTADEILDMLPEHIEGKGWLRVWTGDQEVNGGKAYHVGYADILTEGGWITIPSQADIKSTLADACASMYLYLVKEGLLSPKGEEGGGV